jgi:hypothetical protein
MSNCYKDLSLPNEIGAKLTKKGWSDEDQPFQMLL